MRVSIALSEAVETRRDDRPVLPVPAALRTLLPGGGLRRGAVVTADDDALCLGLGAGASAVGGWVAIVGRPDTGVLAAVEMGIDPHRLLLVDDPGERWAEVAAALADGVDVVLARPATPPAPALARRLEAVARRHGTALVVTGAWPGADVRLSVASARWSGLGDGHGLLTGRLVTVTAAGRGNAGRPRTADLWLPGADGTIEAAVPRPARVPVDHENMVNPGFTQAAGRGKPRFTVRSPGEERGAA